MAEKILWGYVILMNVIAFAMMGIDKRRAKKGMWRIPERHLIFYAFIGGALGAWCGMRGFEHKHNKDKFRYGLPLCVLWNAAVIFVIIKFLI